MMNMLLLSAIMVALILVILVLVKKWKIKSEPNYNTLLILGVTFPPIGIATDNNVFSMLGIVYIAIGVIGKLNKK